MFHSSSPRPKHETEIETYVHPLTKPRSLSPKSLEMCTENLGSETGSDIISDLDALSFHAQIPCRVSKKKEAHKKSKGRNDFPPPLTSIDGVRFRAHRENGRLLIECSRFSCSRNRFLAERGNGRLRLSLVRESENNKEVEEEEGESVICYRDDGGRIGCKINGGDWSGGARCNGERTGGSKSSLPSLPFCVAIS